MWQLYASAVRFLKVKLIAVFFVVIVICNFFIVLPLFHSQSSRFRDILFSISHNLNRSTSYQSNRTAADNNITSRCPDLPPGLLGELDVNVTSLLQVSPSFDEISKNNPNLQLGGQYSPGDCISVGPRTAIIIPYRDREVHLRAVLTHLHPILQRQQLDYTVFVVEQDNNETFNKGFLMNVAFKETRRLGALDNQKSPKGVNRNFECYIFHDVDLFTQNDFGMHQCGPNPLHLTEYIDKFNYESYSGTDILYGGVVSIKPELFERVNGYSNIFYGWGGEDEEMRARMRIKNVPIDKPPKVHYRYCSHNHGHVPDPGNKWNRIAYLMIPETAKRIGFDGLNSLSYNIVSIEKLPTHTLIRVNFTREEIYRSVFKGRNIKDYVTSVVR